MAYRIGTRYDPNTGHERGYYINVTTSTRRRQLSFTSRRDANDWADLAMAKGRDHALAVYDAAQRLPRGADPLSGGRVMFEDLAREYIRTRGTTQARATYTGRLDMVRAFPQFQLVPANRLTRDDLEVFAKWLGSHKHSRGQHMAANTQRSCWVFVQSVFKRAVQRGQVPANPCEGVEGKPRRTTSADALALAHPITDDQFAAIVARLRHPASVLVFRLAYATGARIGEVTALGAGSVSVRGTAGRVFVARTWVRDETGRKVLGSTTKGKRAREVSIPAALAREVAAVEPDERGLLFPHWARYRKDWEQARAAAAAEGLAPAGVRIHDLRHSHITNLLRAGVQPNVVKERVGHATVAFLLDRYAHVINDDADAVAGLLDGI